MMPMENVIHVEGLTKYFGEAIGVDNLNFTVKKGEIFGFLGPNGAGKTTTIRLLLYLLHATSGKITLFNKSESKSTEILKRCGYLPGEFSAYAGMTGLEFLRYAAAVRDADPAGQQDLIDRLKIDGGTLNKKIKQLSHGTLQKLGIIQAFFHEPELLILDEPTTALDPLIQEEFYRIIREKREAGSTIFFSSHNLPEVEKICSRVAIIREGRLVALEELDVLKLKISRRLQLTLKEAVEELKLPHAELIKRDNLQYTFLVKGDMEELLKALAALPVKNIFFPEADLEEVFMTYYGGMKDD